MHQDDNTLRGISGP